MHDEPPPAVKSEAISRLQADLAPETLRVLRADRSFPGDAVLDLMTACWLLWYAAAMTDANATEPGELPAFAQIIRNFG